MSQPHMTTHAVALHMLKTGHSYTACILARELGLSVQRANSLIANVMAAKKYQIEEFHAKSTRYIRLLSIVGQDKYNDSQRAQLWNLALFAAQ